jgi:hypothetical protein
MTYCDRCSASQRFSTKEPRYTEATATGFAFGQMRSATRAADYL